ncbi:Beta-xylosidase [Minicystis rosea]|nr:Beta-xylosidase [Minicystis rosea]
MKGSLALGLLGMVACSGGSETRPPHETASGGAAGSAGSTGGSAGSSPAPDAGGAPPSVDAGTNDGGAADASAPCTTTITYGSTWIHGPNHPQSFDVTSDDVTWDGTCIDDGSNSYAVLSNGWKPYFNGRSACAMAIDHHGGCQNVGACTTRVTYGSTWIPAPNHPAQFDDVAGRVYGDGFCINSGNTSHVRLSNGWVPTFQGTSSCAVSYRWQECGGLFDNPVLPFDCPDPGVIHDDAQYVLTCTSGGAAAAFPLFVSTDLVHWEKKGHVFPAGSRPAWATGDFWAPEIHEIGGKYVAYYSARGTDGVLALGAASAPNALGPYTDLGHAFVHDANMGLIDVSAISTGGKSYLIWKEDGNAKGKPTPIHAQELASDGLSLVGSNAPTLITNDRPWEGALVEGPFMVERNGMFYLWYSANGYASPQYAVGVARASSPLGPFEKQSGPLLVTSNAFAGPGHCSVVDAPGGEDVIVYHAWEAGKIGQAPGREVLVDQIVYAGGWPVIAVGPSRSSRVMP